MTDQIDQTGQGPQSPQSMTPEERANMQQQLIDSLHISRNGIIEAADKLFMGAFWAFTHHYHNDEANAGIHGSDVRYSPVTFALAEGMHALDVALPFHFMRHEGTQKVLDHLGQYPLDKGRIENDGKETPA